MNFQVNTVAYGLQQWQRAHWLTTATNSNRNGTPSGFQVLTAHDKRIQNDRQINF